MSDFPSSETPRIPWSDAVRRVPLGSTAAPGPPTARKTQPAKKSPKSHKVAASLGGGSGPEADEDNHDMQKCVKSTNAVVQLPLC